jgi:RNA polymerase sigma-70 factor (ECF subfamily)
MREAGRDDAADLECLRRHLAGDREAFGELLARHRGRMWAVALRTAGNPEDAADALQDAALSAFKAAGNFRQDAAVGTWLYRITVNACLDRLRRQAARPTVHYPDPDSPVWRQATEDPTDMAEQRELRLVLEQALAELPPDQRAAVVLVDVQGLPVEEAAVCSACPAARSRAAAPAAGPSSPPRCAICGTRGPIPTSQYRSTVLPHKIRNGVPGDRATGAPWHDAEPPDVR